MCRLQQTSLFVKVIAASTDLTWDSEACVSLAMPRAVRCSCSRSLRIVCRNVSSGGSSTFFFFAIHYPWVVGFDGYAPECHPIVHVRQLFGLVLIKTAIYDIWSTPVD